MGKKLPGVRWLIFGLAACVACGSKTPSAPTTPTTPTQPAAVGLTAAQLGTLENAFVSVENAAAPGFLDQIESSGVSLLSGQTTPINASLPCTTGTVGMTGTVGLSKGDSNYSLTTSGPLVFSNCATGGVVLQGSLTETGQMVFSFTQQGGTSYVQVANPVTFTTNGSLSFVLDGVTGSVSFNCSNQLTFTPPVLLPPPNFPVGTIAATGNATLQYPTGQNTTTAPCSAFASGFNLGRSGS